MILRNDVDEAHQLRCQSTFIFGISFVMQQGILGREKHAVYWYLKCVCPSHYGVSSYSTVRLAVGVAFVFMCLAEVRGSGFWVCTFEVIGLHCIWATGCWRTFARIQGADKILCHHPCRRPNPSHSNRSVKR